MIESTRTFTRKYMPTDIPNMRVLEVGSMEINSDGTLGFLIPSGAEYITTDIREGPNVDIVVNAHDLLTEFGPESFDVVMCFDTFEHDDAFWISWQNIRAILKSGGTVLLGVPGRNCYYHPHPRDYWRFTVDSFEDYFFKDFEDVIIWTQPDVTIDNSHVGDDWIYGKGRKPK